MHKHMLSLKQRPVQRRRLWFSSPSAGHVHQHLLCLLLLIVLRKIHDLAERRLHWQLQCLHFLFLRLLQLWILLRLLLLIWLQRQQRRL